MTKKYDERTNIFFFNNNYLNVCFATGIILHAWAKLRILFYSSHYLSRRYIDIFNYCYLSTFIFGFDFTRNVLLLCYFSAIYMYVYLIHSRMSQSGWFQREKVKADRMG